MDKEKMNLYGLLFTYNPYRESWYCFTRDDAAAYWGDGETVFHKECLYGTGESPSEAHVNYITKSNK